MLGMLDDMLNGREILELDGHQTQSLIRYIEEQVMAGLPVEEELKLHASSFKRSKDCWS